MYFGFQSMTEFSFITIGFAIVMIGALGFGITFLIGRATGGREALRFSRWWALAIATAIIATILFALITRQWALFLIDFGYGPLAEMGVLAAGWLLVMWFMATQYALGRIELDDKFGRASEMNRTCGTDETALEVTSGDDDG